MITNHLARVVLLSIIYIALNSSSYAAPQDVDIYLALNEKITKIHKRSVDNQYEKLIMALNQKASVNKNKVNSFSDHQQTMRTTQLKEKQLEVTATAYTSHVNQTDSTPTIAAWGDRLKPTTRAIAVSRDLLTHYGLKHRTKVKIKGLPGEFLVLDKMNKRWRKKIDIYMGMNKKAAFQWGKRKVIMSWHHGAA